MSQGERQSVENLLAVARARLRRVDAQTAADMVNEDGLLVDIRPMEQRKRDGEVPGALVISRNVLEWRLDPASHHHLPQVLSYEQPIVIMCAEGYSSSFAAATLQDLGLVAATDLIGGFDAWRDAGLPTRPVSRWRDLCQRLRSLTPFADKTGSSEGLSH